MLVKQVIPGFHCRALLGVTKPLCDCDRCLGTLWERLTPGESQSFAIETAAVLLARPDAAEAPGGGIMIAADRNEIRRFVQAMFPHADEDVFASVRCFPQKGHGAPEIRAVRIDGTGLEPLVSTAFAVASRAARDEKATVVCLLIAGFANAERAREEDVANCLALSVDLDSNPGRGLEFLRGLLGPPTLVVESGGVWTSPETGAVEPKLHVYWRLSEPTRTPEEHARLKRGRALATALVGGDASNVPLVHPLRLPGSVHRKGEPRLARIIEENPDCEIHLEDALEALETAAQAQGVAIARGGEGGNGAGDPREDQAIIADILSGTAYHTSLVALSARYAGRGMPGRRSSRPSRGSCGWSRWRSSTAASRGGGRPATTISSASWPRRWRSSPPTRRSPT